MVDAMDVMDMIATDLGGGMKRWFWSFMALVALVVPAYAESVRWPANVCAELVAEEALVADAWRDHSRERAVGRQRILVMLRDGCGVDVRAKWAADSAAKPPGGRTQKVSRSRTRTNCTTVKIDDELSNTVCN
jgi:hypothetical protein